MLDSFTSIIKKCKERVEYENYINSLIYLTNFSFEAIDEYFKKRINLNFENGVLKKESKQINRTTLNKTRNNKFDKIQKMLIRFAFLNRKTIEDINSFCEDDNLFTSDVYKKIYGEICLFYQNYEVEEIKLNNFINFINTNVNDENELNHIINSTNDIYEMKIYDEFSDSMIKDLVKNLSKEKNISKNNEIRKNLVKNATNENDMFYLGAIINVKKMKIF